MATVQCDIDLWRWCRPASLLLACLQCCLPLCLSVCDSSSLAGPLQCSARRRRCKCQIGRPVLFCPRRPILPSVQFSFHSPTLIARDEGARSIWLAGPFHSVPLAAACTCTDVTGVDERMVGCENDDERSTARPPVVIWPLTTVRHVLCVHRPLCPLFVSLSRDTHRTYFVRSASFPLQSWKSETQYAGCHWWKKKRPKLEWVTLHNHAPFRDG